MGKYWVVRCHDCGRHFRSVERDQVMCLDCLFALMAEDEPDTDPRAEYAEMIAGLPPLERRRLYACEWGAATERERGER